MRLIKRWDSSMSDGCSVPEFLRLVVPQETPAQWAVCERHDEEYYYGGSRAHRRAADGRLYTGLVAAGMGRPRAWSYWFLVRLGGAPWFRVKGVSWAFGEAYFKYSKDPAQPRSEA